MRIKLVTIGIYGFEEAGFFNALRQTQVDTFCDVRQRRGVRGAAYAFANSRRLQERLAALGIRYVHCRTLAPTAAMRNFQKEKDRENRQAKRLRHALSSGFVSAYVDDILTALEPGEWLATLPPDAQVVALCCVERDPAACHRSLLADALAQALGVEVEHILPL